MQSTPLLSAWTTRPPRLLLADRDADSRRLYAEYLLLASFVIEEAEDGREALAKAISRQPDIVVAEAWLPFISGFELCRLLRRDQATSTIPIVVVTGGSIESDARLAKGAGADVVLSKPCLPETLLIEIDQLLDRLRELRERDRAVSETAAAPWAHSTQLLDRSRDKIRRTMLNHAHNRRNTTSPPLTPPLLICSECIKPLRYQHSQIGGVNERHAEQWDYFECPTGCGTFQYRQRTRKLRHIA